MRFKSRFFKISIVLGVLIILFVVSMLWQERVPEGGKSSGMGISLARPAFAQEDGVSFLEQEAGIAAYMNAGQAIDLSKVKSAFRTVERETGEYIIGSVPLSGYPETEDVHAYIHRDGWVATYYIKDEPAAKILDWNDYDEDEEIKRTKLEIGVVAICTAASVPTKDIRYYDFRYQDASKLLIVAEALWNIYGDETFKIKLPGDFVFYERSYSLHSNEPDWAHPTYMKLDGTQISKTTSYDTKYDVLSPTQLSLDTFHTIGISSWPGFGAIVLIYQEP